MKITFIATGGTIDKDYSNKAGTHNFEISEPAIKRIIGGINVNFDYEYFSILKKDSLDMEDNDRKLVYDTCKKTRNNKIIITHGTDTMIKTAEKLSVLKDKTIILVGSSKPERFKESDANFNIGVAVGAINLLRGGTYIAMNGRVYEWDKVRKETSTGQFIEL